MVDLVTEAKSSGEGVTSPYSQTEHCENIHEYRCDTRVGVIGIDVSKEHLVTSKGRVRKFTNNEKGYEEILTMKPNIIVIEPTRVYSTRPCQYFKERGVKVLLVSTTLLWKEKDVRGKRFLRRRKT